VNTFLKLNAISILYAFIIIIPIELFVNASRISRLTGSNLDEAGKVIGVVSIASVILLSALTIYTTKRWMKGRISSFWSVLLWFPYFILFTYIFASLFSITNPIDEGGPGDGFIILGLLFVYPFLVLLLNIFGIYMDNKNRTN
jgi:hypothetical protein